MNSQHKAKNESENKINEHNKKYAVIHKTQLDGEKERNKKSSAS